MHRCTISHIDPDSPLRHAAHPGDRLVSINGNPITDVLDYKYYAYDPQLAVCLRRPDGSEHTVHIVKPLGGELGLDFETYLMDNAHSCANHCVFCFIDQMPPGMRPTLYFKDDDARLSFLMGNYMTLTNLSEREVQRIIHLHISPINVSVHATDPELRSFLLGNPRAGKTLEIMRRFSDGGITMNCQIVCCRVGTGFCTDGGARQSDGAAAAGAAAHDARSCGALSAGAQRVDRAGRSDEVPRGALSAHAVHA